MEANFVPGTASFSSSLIELTVSARYLLGRNSLSNCDHMCVVSIIPCLESRWVEFKRTEVINRNSNPDFMTKIIIRHHFEEQQKMKFEIFDVNTERLDSIDNYAVGSLETTLGEIVSSGYFHQKLQHPKQLDSVSEIRIVSEELSPCNKQITAKFSAKDIVAHHWYSDLKLFLVFSKSTERGEFVTVHQTERQKNDYDPKWQLFNISLSAFCNGDIDRNMKVECLNYKAHGNHYLVGEFFTTVRQLLNTQSFELLNPSKVHKKSYKNSGVVMVDNFFLEPGYSFTEFLSGGTQLHCTFAIDFTASNGDPSLPESLHYVHGDDNPYIQAIQSIGSILIDYDSNQLFPVLGFGAKIPPYGTISHEFYVNGDTESPYCNGINGVLEAYKACLQRIQLFGPTNFAPCINHVANFAAANRDGKNYFILVIITDGVITDMPQTRDAIIRASELPISIVIVGVGEDDFSSIEALCSNSELLRDRDRVCTRAIIQFILFKKYMTASNAALAKKVLYRELLENFPTQFLEYMNANKVRPGPSACSSDNSLPPI